MKGRQSRARHRARSTGREAEVSPDRSASPAAGATRPRPRVTTAQGSAAPAAARPTTPASLPTIPGITPRAISAGTPCRSGARASRSTARAAASGSTVWDCGAAQSSASAVWARSGRPSASRSRPESSSCPSSAPSASARRARATSHAGATAGRCRGEPGSARPDAPEVLGWHIPTPQPVWSLKQQRSARKMGLKMTVQTDHTPRSRALRRHRQATLRRNITRRLCRGVSLAWPQSRRSGTLTRHCDGPALPPHCLDHRRDSPYRHSVGDGRHHRLASRLPEEEARLRRLDQFPGALRRLLGDHVAAAALGSAIDALISRELAT